MSVIVPLHLPQTKLKLSREDNQVFVECLVRRKKLVLTPEEWVRQHFISYLNLQLKYPLTRIAVEKSILYAGLTKRWDIVVYDADFQVHILVECKAPHIPLSLDTLYQALTYQKEMQGKYIALTNGLQHAYFGVDVTQKSLLELSQLPVNA